MTEQKAYRWKPLILVGVVLLLMAAAKYFGLGDRLAELKDWIASLGGWGPLVFILIYILATLAAVPGLALTIVAGAVFGVFWGTIWVSIASTAGAGLAFLLARYFAREAVVGWLGSNEQFRKLDDLTNRHGGIMVAITRLVPVFPFNVLNYGFGLTAVNFWTYLGFSWLCMLPGTLLYVAGADLAFTGFAGGRISPGLIGVVLLAILLLFGLVRVARSKLKEEA